MSAPLFRAFLLVSNDNPPAIAINASGCDFFTSVINSQGCSLFPS